MPARGVWPISVPSESPASSEGRGLCHQMAPPPSSILSGSERRTPFSPCLPSPPKFQPSFPQANGPLCSELPFPASQNEKDGGNHSFLWGLNRSHSGACPLRPSSGKGSIIVMAGTPGSRPLLCPVLSTLQDGLWPCAPFQPVAHTRAGPAVPLLWATPPQLGAKQHSLAARSLTWASDRSRLSRSPSRTFPSRPGDSEARYQLSQSLKYPMLIYW